jgi:hypothetical protein
MAFVQAALLGLAAITVCFTADLRRRSIVELDLDARQGEWNKVLALARHIPNLPAASRVDANRALFHAGGLGETLFSIPQTKSNLFIPDVRAGNASFLPLSDLWLELGVVNAAQHYASEALEIRGPSPWTLRQLARITLVKGKPLASRVFLSRLKQSPLHRAWAEDQLRAVENGTAEHDPNVCGLQALCLPTDVPSEGWPPEDLLSRLLENNATNGWLLNTLPLTCCCPSSWSDSFENWST